MLTKTDISRLLRDTENERVERTTSTTNTDKFGRGINMVQNTLQTNGNAPARFILDDITTFKVIVPHAGQPLKDETASSNVSGHVSGHVNGHVSGSTQKQTTSAPKRRTLIINLIRQNNNYSVSQLAKLLGVSPRTIARDISLLKAENQLQRIGDENTGHWLIPETHKA